MAVDRYRSVWPLASCIPWRVGIIIATLFVGGVVIDHRVHVAGRHAEEQVRATQYREGVCRMPVGLRDHADPEALGLQDPANDRHAEARVINVTVARDDDDVATVPTELSHFRA